MAKVTKKDMRHFKFGHDFAWAIEQLDNGHSIRRMAWHNSREPGLPDVYRQGTTSIWVLMLDESGARITRSWTPSINDLKANDWGYGS